MTTLPTHRPVAPGDVLKAEALNQTLTLQDIADMMGTPYETVRDIVTRRTPVTLPIAEKLSVAVGGTPALWMALQLTWEWAQMARQRPA